MPNRILHESIKYCPKMEQLNWFEEVVYHRLTVTVDDYGCLDGRIVLLKNTLFPTREDISKDDIARAIEHMVALGLLRAYEAGGMPYLCFPAWEEEQRVRNKRRKFPAPPDEEEPLAAEDSLSAADGGALFAGEKHLTASCCQLTAGCPPESNPYPYPYPYPDSNPKFESGSVTYPYPNPYPRRVRVRALARRGTGERRERLRGKTARRRGLPPRPARFPGGYAVFGQEAARLASAPPSKGAREAPRAGARSRAGAKQIFALPAKLGWRGAEKYAIMRMGSALGRRGGQAARRADSAPQWTVWSGKMYLAARNAFFAGRDMLY